MKKFTFGLVLLLLICLAATHTASAQAFGRVSRNRADIGYISVGVTAGATNYFGDLNPLAQYVSTDIRSTRMSFGVNINRKFSPRFMGRVSLAWLRLAGDDNTAANPNDARHRYRWIRNAHFRNDVYELSGVISYDLVPSKGQYYRRKNYVPYIFGGLAVYYHNPMAKSPDAFGGKWTYLRALRTEGQGLTRSVDSPRGDLAGSTYKGMYSLWQIAVPLGAGVRMKLSDRWDLSFELGYRILFTDYIDDVNGDYANPDDLPGDLSRAMANRTLDTRSVRSGRDRTETLARLAEILGPPNNVGFNGYGNDGDKRGEPNNPDVYIFTGFHLNYIINVGLRCPKFR